MQPPQAGTTVRCKVGHKPTGNAPTPARSESPAAQATSGSRQPASAVTGQPLSSATPSSQATQMSPSGTISSQVQVYSAQLQSSAGQSGQYRHPNNHADEQPPAAQTQTAVLRLARWRLHPPHRPLHPTPQPKLRLPSRQYRARFDICFPGCPDSSNNYSAQRQPYGTGSTANAWQTGPGTSRQPYDPA